MTTNQDKETTVNQGFEKALAAIKVGATARRCTWDDDRMFIQICPQTDPYQKSYIFQLNKEGYIVPWSPTHEDILASDWEIVK